VPTRSMEMRNVDDGALDVRVDELDPESSGCQRPLIQVGLGTRTLVLVVLAEHQNR